MSPHLHTLELYPQGGHAPQMLTRRCGPDDVARLVEVARAQMLVSTRFQSDALAGVDWGPLAVAFHRVDHTAALAMWSARAPDRQGEPFSGRFDAYTVLLSGLSLTSDSAAIGILRDNVDCTEAMCEALTTAPRPVAAHVYLNPQIRSDTIVCSAADAIAFAFFGLIGAARDDGQPPPPSPAVPPSDPRQP